jgi:hypothetical protein
MLGYDGRGSTLSNIERRIYIHQSGGSIVRSYSSAVIAPSESLNIQELTGTAEIASLEAAIRSHRLDTDVDALLLMHSSAKQPTQYLQWYVPMLTSAGTVFILYVI